MFSNAARLALAALALPFALLPRAALADGCTKDTDCKGDRICVQGACVNPTAAPVAPPAAAVTPPAAPAAPLPVGANMVRVTIESNEPSAVLARVVGRGVAYASGPGGTASATSTDYAMVCTVPCGTAVDRNFEYVFQHVSGFGGLSSPFILPTRSDVTLKVESRSQGAWILGFIGTTLTGTGVLLGGTFWGVGAGVGDDDFATTGMVVTLISAPLMAGSIYLMVANNTSVTTEAGEELADAGAPVPAAPAAVVGLDRRAPRPDSRGAPIAVRGGSSSPVAGLLFAPVSLAFSF